MINVSIVTYKTEKSEVKNTIATCASSSYVNKIYIVDNSPDDTLRRFLEDENDKISYLHNPSNPGYGAAHNIAMQLSIQEKTPYHLVLNADTVFDPEILTTLPLSPPERFGTVMASAESVLVDLTNAIDYTPSLTSSKYVSSVTAPVLSELLIIS